MRAMTIGVAVVVVGGAAAGGLYLTLGQSGPKADQPTWEHTYGSSGRDEATHAAPTADGGTVIAGERTAEGKSDSDAWVLRLDAKGVTVWERSWGGPGDEHVEDIQASQDGGFIVTGETQGHTSGVGQAWVAKLSDGGEVLWHRNYESKRLGTMHSVISSADGGYVVAGAQQSENPSYYDGWVARIDAKGQPLWEHYYGGANDEAIEAIRETPDGGFVFAGTTESQGAGRTDAWIVKLDGLGVVQWERTYGSSARDAALDIQVLGDQGYIVAGWSDARAERDKRDGWVIRLNAKGDKIWERIYGGREEDVAREIRPSNDGGFVVVGTTNSKGAGRLDAWVFRIDATGKVLWDRALGGADDDEATAVVPMLDGAFVVAGRERSKGAGRQDAWVMRLNALGRIAHVN
jgi:hypothetical protein